MKTRVPMKAEPQTNRGPQITICQWIINGAGLAKGS
jgi:hypothetical protein